VARPEALLRVLAMAVLTRPLNLPLKVASISKQSKAPDGCEIDIYRVIPPRPWTSFECSACKVESLIIYTVRTQLPRSFPGEKTSMKAMNHGAPLSDIVLLLLGLAENIYFGYERLTL